MGKKKWDLEDIEQFILKSGSDDLPTFGGSFEGGCHCQQIYDEFSPMILELINSGENLENYLEVGVAAGGTTKILNHFFKFKTSVLIDDNKHPKAQLRSQVLKDVNVKELIGNSFEMRIIVAAENLGPYDLIFIDGNHKLKFVELDAANYFPMLRKGGFIAFHDSVMEEWGVCKIVSDLRNDPSVNFIGEYVTKTNTRACGLALFQKAI